MQMRLLTLCGIVIAAALLLPAAVSAKQFRPGDLQICNETACAVIADQDALNALARLYYGRPAPGPIRAPQIGKPYFQLRFGNQYLTGIVAMDHLDRFLSHGVDMGQFAVGVWYRVPPRAAAALRRLAASIPPLRINRSTTASTAR
jgi:hypothetical protein